MSWKGPRKVGEPSPPFAKGDKGEGKKKLTKKGKEIRSKVENKRIKKDVIERSIIKLKKDIKKYSKVEQAKEHFKKAIKLANKMIKTKDISSFNETTKLFLSERNKGHASVKKYVFDDIKNTLKTDKSLTEKDKNHLRKLMDRYKRHIKLEEKMDEHFKLFSQGKKSPNYRKDMDRYLSSKNMGNDYRDYFY